MRKLIAGPTVFICNECVELCLDIVGEENRSLEGRPLAQYTNRQRGRLLAYVPQSHIATFAFTVEAVGPCIAMYSAAPLRTIAKSR